jgi:hypothetical protein
MGLLSSRTFRQIATGALTGIEEKRNDMRDRIDTYREKAVNKKNEIQKKYNAYYDEEKENINTFKTVATAAGDDYLPALNSFVGTDPSRLSIFNNMQPDDIRTELDKYKDTAPTDTGFIQSRQERLKLKESELNQNLQDQVGLFKGTSTLFTRDIEDRGVKDIQAEVGTLESQRLKKDFNAGAGIGIKTNLRLSEVKNNNDIYSDLFMEEMIGDQKTGNIIPKPGFKQYIQDIDTSVSLMISNGYQGTEAEARAEVIEQKNNPSYKGDNLVFLTTAADNAPIIDNAITIFNQARDSRNVEEMKEAISTLEKVNRLEEADELKLQLKEFEKNEKNLTAEIVKERALEGEDDTKSDKIIDFQVDKPSFRKEYKDILSRSEWSNLSEDKVREIYKLIDEGKYTKPEKKEPEKEERKPLTTKGASDSDKAVIDGINTFLGLS